MIVKGVQEGRQLYGGKFDLDDIWSRRDLTLSQDSTAVDTLSADRDVPFIFLLAYQPDSLAEALGITPIQAENQMLYQMARFNFTNFLVRNFDLETEHEEGYNRMLIRGFLNFDEALQYARQLTAAPELSDMLRHCRTIVVSEHNLAMLGKRYSFRDYDEFYEQTFLPLPVSNEELLQVPDYELPTELDNEEDAGAEDVDDDSPQPQQNNGGGFDFDEDFW